MNLEYTYCIYSLHNYSTYKTNDNEADGRLFSLYTSESKIKCKIDLL